MNVSVAYVYPLVRTRKYFPLASRFADTYQRFDPGYEHTLTILCNGHAPSTNEVRMFEKIPHQIMVHNNMGWDIGAYQHFAEIIECDLMVCLGANIHAHRAGWLRAMVEAYERHGAGLYGCTCYGGFMFHVRTTVFWCPPEILRSYPAYAGSSRASRYEFEHGKTSFTRHVLSLGFPCVMATWLGSYDFDQWDGHQPDWKTILVRDQHIHEPDSRLD